MIERTQERFGLWPERLAADTGYGSAENLAWLVHERGIEPHIPVFDKSERRDGTFDRADFIYDHRPMATPARAARSSAAPDDASRPPRPFVDDDG